MQVDVRFLDNLRLEASFDDFKVITDQPIRYKGDGTAPGPFDYFLASSALCAAYFVKIYCKAREIPTEDIKIFQNNIVDPDNRYKQTLHLQIELPESISSKDREGILRAMDRCSVKRVIQNSPDFIIEAKNILGSNSNNIFKLDPEIKTNIPGKDRPLEETISQMTSVLENLGINIEIASWRNLVPHVWSVHIRDADSPICYTNGKGSTKEAALASALGEYIERISNNYFYNDYYLGKEIAESDFVHYPNEKWFPITPHFSEDLMDDYLLSIYNSDGELSPKHLVDTNSGNIEKGICSIPFTRQSDQKEVFIPVNLIGNLFVSNGMSAGNTKYEARVQAISEIFERAVKNQIIREELTLPDVPKEVLQQFPNIYEGIKTLEDKGFPILVKDASLGGKFPVMCVTLMNPKNGGVYASFGAHPNFEIALERSLTELLQGRSFEGLNDVMAPSFNSLAVSEHNNIIDHFIDSVGVISWKFFSQKSNYDFHHWNFSGSTKQEYEYLMEIFKQLEKEVYIADYTELGAYACRVLVPNYSEIYESSDLIWDNHNRSINFREQILNLHSLDNEELEQLYEDLEESGLDDHMAISELIGIAFEETTNWGQLTIGELKLLVLLALSRLEEAKEISELFVAYSDSLPERKKFYQGLNTLLDISLDEELEFEDYQLNLNKVYGADLIANIQACIEGQSKFFGLGPISNDINNIDKHKKLIKSYQKLQAARKDHTYN